MSTAGFARDAPAPREGRSCQALGERLRDVEGRLVVRMPNWIGDALLAVPSVRALRSMAPAAQLELHARRPVAEVLRSLRPLADRVVTAGESSLRGVLRDARRLRGAAACVLLPNSFAAALPPWLARVPLRAGTATDGRGPLLSLRTVPGRGHMASYYRGVVGASEAIQADESRVELEPSVAELSRSLADAGAYAALVPGAAFGTAKRWLPERFAAAGRRLLRLGLDVLVLGTERERAAAEGVAAACGGRSLAGRTSGQTFAGLLAGARIAVVNDSGAMHLAAALRTPVVAIFGATDPAATGPIGGRHRVLYRPPECSPCGQRQCTRPRHECMEAVSVDAVVAAAEELLGSAGAPE